MRSDDEMDEEEPHEPAHFRDLNLDQVVEAIVASRERYGLKPLLWTPLHDVESVVFRQEALRDLEDDRLRRAVDDFAAGMVVMRRRRKHASQLRHRYHRDRWWRDSVKVYCETVTALADALDHLDVASQAFTGLRRYLRRYATSEYFTTLAAEGRDLEEELAAVRYTVRIRGDRVSVLRYEGGDDYSEDVERTFAKFKQGDVKDHRVAYPASADLNHVEARILELVGGLFPDVFSRLDDYCTRNRDYVDASIARFDREVQFYLAYLDYIAPIRRAGLPFCYPQVSTTSKETNVVGGFDLALAAKLFRTPAAVISNDFRLVDQERLLLVTGPNQGGKTTFARMFGQLHYLAGLGFPVPGQEAALSLPDRVFTHFEREEQIETLRGKLADELVRIHGVLDQATTDSVIVINEGFSSTTLRDAVFLGTEVLKRMLALDLLSVYVTFVDELASLSEATVSMMATVDPNDPALRTFRVVRRPADGLAYAAAIVRKYGLDYDRLRKRLTS